MPADDTSDPGFPPAQDTPNPGTAGVPPVHAAPACPPCAAPMGRLAIALVPIALISVYLAFFRPEPAPPESPSARDFDSKSDAYLDSTDRYAQPSPSPTDQPADQPASLAPEPAPNPPAKPDGG